MRSSRFSPRSLAHPQLERLTVAREGLLVRLQTAVVDAVVSGQARFDLVLGPRGAGKSHLIGVLEGRLRASPKLLGRTVVVALPEELHPLSLVQFLAQLLGELPEDPELGSTAEALRSLRRQRDPNQERRAVELIRGRLAGRSLIILVEQLDELFSALGRDGQQRLRNVLQTERRWSMVATSRSLSPAFTKYEAPFHGTFNLHRLEPLSPEHCRDMLAVLADAHDNEALSASLRSPEGLARVRGLHHLLGGNPRAMAILFRQLDEHRLDHFEQALADLADELEPYFQEQVARISPTQRAIMELLAESWRPLTVTELSELGFIAQATTSNALRHLRGEALVQVLEVGRERYYELGDPLLRLARANQRPREAIAGVARVARWWHAQDRDVDSIVQHYEVVPKRARAEFAAHDGLAGNMLSSLTPVVASAAGRVIQATVQADDPASRRALLDTLANASPDVARSLSDSISGSALLMRWIRHAALADLGELLVRLRPTQRSPTLEADLPRAIGLAWHEQRLAELLPAGASLEPLLAVLPESVRRLLGLAVELTSESRSPSPGVDYVAHVVASLSAEVPAGELTHNHAIELTVFGLVLDLLRRAAHLPTPSGVDSVMDSLDGERSRDALLLGLYHWLASRRSLAPLEPLAARLTAVRDIEWFPPGVLASARPREAVARLSEPERAIIRTILEHHRDHRGLEALALQARR